MINLNFLISLRSIVTAFVFATKSCQHPPVGFAVSFRPRGNNSRIAEHILWNLILETLEYFEMCQLDDSSRPIARILAFFFAGYLRATLYIFIGEKL